MPALLAGTPGVIVPEIEHGLAKVLNDISAIEIDVFDQGPAMIAVENDVFVFARGTAAFDNDADRVWWANGRVRDVRWNEKRLPLAHKVIDDPVLLSDTNFDVAFKLKKVFLRIDQVKVVSGVWPLDHHDEKVPAVVKVTVAHRGLEEMAVFLDPAFQIDGRLDGGCCVAGCFW
jgi:hypothetical protein